MTINDAGLRFANPAYLAIVYGTNIILVLIDFSRSEPQVHDRSRKVSLSRTHPLLHVDVRDFNQFRQRRCIDVATRSELYMAHEFAGAFQ